MSKPRLLDLFCGAGGCSMGYHRAGFEVFGVDIKPQPHYPFESVHLDALEYARVYGHQFDAIHASPPCQAYSNCTPISRRAVHRNHADLIGPTRNLLEEIGRPYVIENVANAPLRSAILLCGSMFGLDVRRHRLFESNVMLLAPSCRHARQTPRFRSLDSRQKNKARVVGVHGSTNYKGELALRKAAMGIDWMNNRELTQAIPPAYTEFIGKQLLNIIGEPCKPQ